ncbi:glucose oxidase [Bisporella sp. PMI_857]|nr:glucose oxidase [Bisporella sp. PMI_857]
MVNVSALLSVIVLFNGLKNALAESFDYIVVGAGTSGLVIANRLSEDPSVTVAVIEPGTDQRDNPLVTDVEKFTLSFGTEIDWQYNITAQAGANSRELLLHQGKALGGTSTINAMTYIRANAPEIDSWEKLGSQGWNWKALLPYYKKSENYTIPTTAQLAAGATYQSTYHGYSGHVHVGYPSTLSNGSFSAPVLETWKSLSLPHNPDLNSGSLRGFSMGPQTLDGATNIRYDSARAYYQPIDRRSNLKIIKGTVKRITWIKQRNRGRVVADGVEYLIDNGTLNILKASKEVIVSAGAVRTPLVLESSGVGNPRILKSLGIETVVDLPGVGENLIEQPNNFIGYSGNLEPSPSGYHTFITAGDVFGSSLAEVEKSTRAKLSKWAQAIVDASHNGAPSFKAVRELLRIQHDLLFKQNITFAEIITVIPPSLLASNFWILFPFSRGSVHLQSAEDINNPLIDPRFFLADFDLSGTVAVAKYVRRFWNSQPISQYATGQVLPAPEVVPSNATDAQWEGFVKDSLNANSHGLGTASMMAKELGGVVDPELRVYGTANVRVVDASVLPTQISGHLTATLYAVAERAADIIKRTSI